MLERLQSAEQATQCGLQECMQVALQLGSGFVPYLHDIVFTLTMYVVRET